MTEQTKTAYETAAAEWEEIHQRGLAALAMMEKPAAALEAVAEKFNRIYGWKVRVGIDPSPETLGRLSGLLVYVRDTPEAREPVSVGRMIEFCAAVRMVDGLSLDEKCDDYGAISARTYDGEVLKADTDQPIVPLHVRFFVSGETCRYVKVGVKTEPVFELHCEGGAR